MSKLTLGSLFDGSGGFPLGAVLTGIEPLWASEVEPFPIRVTTKRFPNMKHYGDINKIDGSLIPPVDIITAGFCCQDLSVAGKRAGLQGERSGLFYQIPRIIKEMLAATNNEYPKFAVLENVPGMYSSAGGADFQEVLNELIQIKDETLSVPLPEKGKWSTSGEIVGDGFSVGWRTLDAQFWGVPQHRKRIFLVADFRGRCAGKILFVAESLRGDTAEGKSAGERVTGDVESGVGTTSEASDGSLTPWDVQSRRIYPEDGKWPAIYGGEGGGHGYVAQAAGFKWGNSKDARSIGYEEEKAPTLAGSSGGNMVPAIIQATGFEGNIARTLTARNDGSPCVDRGPNIVAVYDMAHAAEVMRSVKGDKANTLNSRMGTGGNQVQVVCQPTMLAVGVSESPDLAHCLRSGASKADKHESTTYVLAEPAYWDGGQVADCLDASNASKQQAMPEKRMFQAVRVGYKVRRLTPTECERLQGFPDGWTEGHSDTVRYKALGNSVAIPCVEFVIGSIKRFMEVEQTK